MMLSYMPFALDDTIRDACRQSDYLATYAAAEKILRFDERRHVAAIVELIAFILFFKSIHPKIYVPPG